MIWEKYKWFILGYVLYVSIVLASIWNQRREFWPLFIIWCITIPVALYIIGSLVSKYLKKKKSCNEIPATIVSNTTETHENINDNKNPNSDLVNSWSLVDFAKLHGKMQVGEFENKVTGEKFKSCIFTDKKGSTIYVSFYSKLGILTPQQIKERKDNLKVGLLNTNKYVLYEVWDGWSDVNLIRNT